MKALTGVARAICYALAHAIDMAHAERGRRSAPLAGARQSADADRQGVRDRHRRRGELARRPGAWRHGLHRGDRGGEPLSRRPHRADLRRHQRHPGDRPRHPQAAAGGRPACARLYRRAWRERRGDPHLQSRRLRARRRSDRQGDRRPARSDALPAGCCWPTASRTGAGRRDALSPAVRADRRRRLSRARRARRRGARADRALPLLLRTICSARPRP